MDPLDIQPFAFLPPDQRALVRATLKRRKPRPKTPLIELGSDDIDCVFLITAGAVEVFDEPDGKRLAIIEAGSYFGERSVLFGGTRSNHVVTKGHTEVHELPGDELLRLLRDVPVFAQAFGDILRDKQGLFVAFDRFLAELVHGVNRGHIVVPRLLDLYRQLQPALHRGANKADVIDFGALEYALRRLPDNVDRTFSWFLVDDLPYLYTRAPETFTGVPSAARRRAIWQMLPGKNLVLLRDGMSDLIDLVTCLCVYAVEAAKLRKRIGTPETLLALVSPDEEEALYRLSLSPAERAQLFELCGSDTRRKLADIAMHNEDFLITVYRSTDNYNADHAERWTRQVAEATQRLMGQVPAALPADLPVHVVSSNTHSVQNCLSAWLRTHRADILAWGEAAQPGIVQQDWHDERDLAVALLRPYLAAHPGALEQMHALDRSEGVITLKETVFTGIEVQLFDLSALPEAALPEGMSSTEGLLINIDYAFGQQAEPIIAGLLKLFGNNIHSINVLGKAGGLVGERGDIFVANSFVEQQDDAIYRPKVNIDLQRLSARIPGRGVHIGRALTAVGTVVQNDTLLKYYQHIWKCVGLEMEGAWYCRRILEAHQLGVVPRFMDLRFLYYVSDMPLAHGENLAKAMGLSEGIPPLYACTREVLQSIFESKPR